MSRTLQSFLTVVCLLYLGIIRSVDEKLLLLRGQLKKLKEGIDPDYLSLVEEADRVREKRVFVAQVFREYELAAAQEERDKERESAFQQFESKKMELKECLLHDLQDKKKAYDNYRHNVDLGSASKNTVCMCTSESISICFMLLQLIHLNPRQW